MNPAHTSREILLEIARIYGTPTYVYNASFVQHQFRQLTTSFSGFSHRIHFAVKALSNINLLHLLHQEGAYFDCVNLNEIAIAIHIGIPKERILYTPSMPSIQDIETAVAMGVHVHIDSLHILEEFGKRFGNTIPVGIRINPQLAPAGGTLSISTAHVDSKFGIPLEYTDAIIALMKSYQLRIVGLHQHSGSDVKDAGVLLEGLSILGELSVHFPELVYFDIGGGFKVPYYENDVQIDVQNMGTEIAQVVQRIQAKRLLPLCIWFELGKYLVSQAGYLLATVNDIKTTPTKHFLGVNTGFHHLIRPAFYGAYHYIENLSSVSPLVKRYDIAGVLCETDTLAEDRLLPSAQVGDVLAIHNAGAYGFEMSSTFNANFRPAEVLVEGNTHRLIRERDTLEDLLRKQVKTF